MLSKVSSLLASRVLSPASALPAALTKEAGESSYEKFKNVASKSGDPAKEWMQGAKEHARANAQSAEQLYEATKRATQDITTHAKEALQMKGLKDVKQMAGDAGKGAGRAVEGMAAAAGGGSKLSHAADMAAEAVKGAVGDAQEVPSARAEFEASRSEETKAATNRDRKSQLTDEAPGDNPAEQATRDEKQILPNECYTRH